MFGAEAFAIRPSRSPFLERIERWMAQHPEWWMLAIGAAMWLATALIAGHDGLPNVCTAIVGPIATYLANLNASHHSAQLASDYVNWAMMTLAMMPVLIILSVRHVGFRSFSQRRNRAISVFLAGYAGVWLAAGIAVPFVLVAIRSMESLQAQSGTIAVLLAAAVWQFTPFKRRALLKCHRTIALSPVGRAADAACLRFGLMQGRACLASCWALMLITMLASHDLLVMVCVQVALIGERYERRSHIRAMASLPLLGAALALGAA
jgi:predicted metal-binding membrane protein